MDIEDNKQIIQRYFDEVLNGDHYSNLDGMVHDDFYGSNKLDEIRGKEIRKQHGTEIWLAFPDYRNEVKELIAERDKVVVYSKFTATHTGMPFMGCPPTGKKVDIDIVANYRLKDGKIIRGKVLQDMFQLFQQLGFYPLVG